MSDLPDTKLDIVFEHPKINFRSPTFAFANKETLLPTSNYYVVLAAIAMEQTIGYHFVSQHGSDSEPFLATKAIVAGAEEPTDKYIGRLNEALQTHYERIHRRFGGNKWDGYYIGELSPESASDFIKEDIVAEMNKLDPAKRYEQRLGLMHQPLASLETTES